MWWILLIEVLCTLVLTALLLHQYGDLKRMPWYAEAISALILP